MSQKHLQQGDAIPPVKPDVLRIYSMRYCPYAERPLLLIAAKGIDCEIVNCNLTKKPEFLLERNPAGKVPVLEYKGNVVPESVVICDLLEDLFPDKQQKAKDPYQRAKDRLAIGKFESHQTKGQNMEDSKPSTSKSSKETVEVFEDPVHGAMEFKCELLIKIIDTPQFQRLRDIKQLGCTSVVFPGATHSRLAHSLGVCHLADEFLRPLQRNQPELGIKDKDILCVQVAALCHDLGRGPFSHVFENDLLPRLGIKNKKGELLKPNDLSLMMFDHMVEENDLMDVFKQHDIQENDILAIKDMMDGNVEGCKDPRKRFLYEVVVNKRNGIDVSKWDALARDCHHLGIANSFDHRRCMRFARVILVPERKVDDEKGGRVTIPEELQICFKKKEADNLYQMFHAQYMIQRKALKHKITTVIEQMIVKALLRANEHLKIFPGKDGTMLTMSQTLEQQDMHAFTFMTDGIIDQLLSSAEVELDVHVAKEIIKRVKARDVYINAGSVLVPPSAKLRGPDEIAEKISKAKQGLPAEDLIAKAVVINYGLKDKNPMDHVRFYTKETPNDASALADDEILWVPPKRFQERYVLVFCKKPEQASKAGERFKDWCKKALALAHVQSYLGI